MASCARFFATTALRASTKASVARQAAVAANADPIDTPRTSQVSEPTAGPVLTEPVPEGYRRLTHPTLVPLNKLFSNIFPLLVRELWEDYGTRHQPLIAQDRLLLLLPFYPEPDLAGRSAEVVQTELDSGNRINEFVIYPPGTREADPASVNHLIMVHGYGGGLGFFYKNFDQLLSLPNWVVHLIDLLGYGCSLRPPFELAHEDLAHVEAWFHDLYHEWAVKRGLAGLKDQTLIMAHSMGAYLMTTYGLQHPDFCKKLLMVSPGAVIKHRNPPEVPTYFAKLWEQNISPFTLVRKAGPLGSKVVSGWLLRRFAKLPKAEQVALHKYAYAIFQQPGSGEYMLNYLLAPGADARHPLIDRGIHNLDCDMSWWYGREDWMDIVGGRLCSNIINAMGKHHLDVREIEDAGHHLYLDNYPQFNQMMVEEMKQFN